MYTEEAFNQGHTGMWFWLFLFIAVGINQFIHRNDPPDRD